MTNYRVNLLVALWMEQRGDLQPPPDSTSDEFKLINIIKEHD
jgi:hypothetical protein